MRKNQPTKITQERLREHFRSTYKLSDEQIDTMMVSSSKSLKNSIEKLNAELKKGGDLEVISRIGHGLKGLLLNMGEDEWAEVARNIELSAAKNMPIDYRNLTDTITEGVKEILI